MVGERAFLCNICFKAVDLDNCKIDNDGRAVHESCYKEMLERNLFSKESINKKAAIFGTKRRVG